ncbi:MAG: V-type ATP synthase subunit B, partial [Bacteroidales bacterium]|nr:V-type ATP synthase subunit B [Bacteroidales bacterium]
DYDKRCLEFAKDYSNKLLAIDVNISINQMLDTGWELFAKYFTPAETGIKQKFIDKYWKK